MIITINKPEKKVYNLFRWLGNVLDRHARDSTGVIKVNEDRTLLIATDKNAMVFARLIAPLTVLDDKAEYYRPIVISRDLINLETMSVDYINAGIFFSGLPEVGYGTVVRNKITIDSMLFKKATAGFGQVVIAINQINAPMWVTMNSDNFPAGAYFGMIMPMSGGKESERIAQSYNRIKKAFEQEGI